MPGPQAGQLTGQEFVGQADEVDGTARPARARDREAHMVNATRTAQTVVLDTSALMSDPEGIFDAYLGADMVLPLTVVQELDGLKKRLDPAGAAARDVLRRIEALRLAAGGDLSKPFERQLGGTVRMQVNGVQAALLREHGLDADTPDNRIVGTALGLAAAAPHDGPVLVVSNDTALRLTAAAVGLAAAEHNPLDAVPAHARPEGWVNLDADAEAAEELFEQHLVPVSRIPAASDVVENTFAVLRSGTSSALARVRAGSLHLLESLPPVWGLKAANKEQRFALDLLLDDDVKV
ncbi:MAG TPA: PIN domain-containing protein, partial [Acidothermaceae bacterium]